MSNFGRNKIALVLACASVLGGKTQAMNTNRAKTSQIVGAVGGAAVRNQPKKINWAKIVKIFGFSAAGLAALETIHSLIGGFTDSKLGSYSVGRAIRNNVKKNEQPDPKEQKKSNQEINDKIKIKNKKTDKNFDIINEKLKSVKVDENDAKHKDVMLKAFEHFREQIKGCTLDNLANIDIFDYDNNNGNAGKQGLLNIFSDKEKISNVEIEFVPGGQFKPHFVIGFDCDGKKQKIELWDIDNSGGVCVEYFFAYNDNDTKVAFIIGYDKLGLQSE
ncbi:MAG: hypothetical protein J6P21_02940 [Clostridia bacterium]|nr:hypothetical protein [Clostridia bacterium]